MKLLDIHPQYIVNDMGNKTSVVLSIEDFETILDDFEDLLVVAERKSESTTAHKDFLKELEEDGML
jgi:hypothetical protein